MKSSRYTVEQIAFVMWQAESGKCKSSAKMAQIKG